MLYALRPTAELIPSPALSIVEGVKGEAEGLRAGFAQDALVRY